MKTGRGVVVCLGAVIGVAVVAGAIKGKTVQAGGGPVMLDPRLGVTTAVSGLETPIGLAFLGANDMLVLEKSTGRVQRVMDGKVDSTALDLAVNNASERGLLSIALHPDFPATPWVFLYWTCTAPVPADPYQPSQETCAEAAMFGADSSEILGVPLLGNRVDRFVWDGSMLKFDLNLIQLRAFQNDGGPEPPGQGDEGQPARGNHDGGVIRFGPDGKLYVQVGDLGRRGQLQNLPCGPTAVCPGPTVPDDQFGGPEPDDAHLTGVILRLNDDGTAPPDNPFFEASAQMNRGVAANVQKIFAYGIRNGFGMAFDHVSGHLWEQENGDDSFSELNLVDPGMNSGWIQIMGPDDRLGEYKAIETSPMFFGLQQLRWPPTNIANTTAEARQRLFRLPGSHYSAPEMSWRYEVAPGGIGFVQGGGLGAAYRNNLLMAGANPTLMGGHLFHFKLSPNRRRIAVEDFRLEDRVADNNFKYDVTESESLLIGRDFGVGTDIQTGPNGHVYVVSLTNGEIYEIFRRP
jgi:aldose sugar dehydrogenase